jgi:ribonucleoside-diphosphate reductase alpha chain
MSKHIIDAINILSQKYPKINWQGLEQTIRITIRNLDNVIDENFYSTPEAKNANKKHRPIGMGVMGWQEMLHKLDIDMESQEAVDLSDNLFEFISYISIDESVEIALKKGVYSTFEGSKWSKGIFPKDSMEKFLKENRKVVNNTFDGLLDWDFLKQKVKENGLRNSQLLAIAPTRTISYLTGTSPSIEPWDSNVFTEVGMTGKYQVINEQLIKELESLGLWNNSIIEKIRIYEGSIQMITEIPENIRKKYKTAWEIHPKWIIAQNARRQKWVDMGISFNMWLANNNGKDASRLYQEVWKSGQKTTYYLHSKSKTQGEKLAIENANKGTMSTSITADMNIPVVCDMTDPNCEACQ